MFEVILADPPWQYGSRGARSGKFAELDYPTMTIDDLKELPVANWAAKDCALFMWVTGSFIDDALEVGAAWGFEFIRVDKVWAKKTTKGGRHGVVGPWGMTDAEFILLFTRGQICSKQTQRNQFVIVEAEYPGIHSRKPLVFRQMIESRFPSNFKRLELFSREQVPGWTVVGNAIDGRDIRDVLAGEPASTPILFGSVCSGIEAASVAWHPLGWKAAWLAEIEPFPSAVLAHHYPDVPNLGDMTMLADKVSSGHVLAPDVLVGGTPCQAFSVAGLRGGLSDGRGQLTLEFVRLADAIDRKRVAIGQRESIIVWENVPGVLSSKDNAFGCFLAGLAGESEPLEPTRDKWSNAGCVFGPTRTVAWRIFDAQYFGVAQRRRRVFVVASAREGFDPAEVLFEFEGVRRDSAPSREAGKAVAALTANGVGTCGADDNQGQAGHLIPTGFRMTAFGEYSDDETASTMKARDYKDATDLVTQPLQVVHGTQDPCVQSDLAFALGRNNGGENAVAYGIPGNWIGRAPENGGNATEPMHEVAPCQTVADRHAVAYGFQPRIGRNGRGDMGDLVSALTAQAGETGKGDSAPCVAIHENTRGELNETDVNPTLATGGGKPGQGYAAIRQEMQVRRLTPIECERLQGFPDNYTLVPVKSKPAADGPRYKALGNSMAVPVMHWIGKRIQGAMN